MPRVRLHSIPFTILFAVAARHNRSESSLKMTYSRFDSRILAYHPFTIPSGDSSALEAPRRLGSPSGREKRAEGSA
jgi:hypothetical protein